uniref:Uncharacterized protein n=1 Tax=Setaria digitata TaxID=48799 RepID=A0A915PZX1_9BILA
MSSAECLIELDRQPTVKECHEITLKHIEAANDQLSTSASIRFDKMCQALNYFSSCVEGPISHGCGTKAWAMIFRVLRDTTNTLLPKCQFTGHSGLPSDFSASFSSTTTVVSVNKENHLSQYRDMLNDKAEIIWSNEDITASPGQLSQMENDGDQNFGDPLVAGPRRNTINSQGQRSKDEISRHVFIDKDTDISYYDSGSNSLIETASSSSFLASNSANHFCVFVIIFGHYLSFAWLFFKFY